MPIITLISDWSKQDFYLASVKAAIYTGSIQAQVVDITHELSPFNLTQAAFVLRYCWRNFPEGTVHLVCINTEHRTPARILCLEVEGQYFITADNGISGILFDEDPDRVILIEKWTTQGVFTPLDVFVPAACHLINGGKITDLGKKADHWQKLQAIIPVVDESVIMGNVVYIDSYKNAITNISRDLFAKIGKGRNFEILVQSNHYRINKLNNTYHETTGGELLALFNSVGLLEIAICDGNAADLLNLDLRSVVRIKFNPLHVI